MLIVKMFMIDSDIHPANEVIEIVKNLSTFAWFTYLHIAPSNLLKILGSRWEIKLAVMAST